MDAVWCRGRTEELARAAAASLVLALGTAPKQVQGQRIGRIAYAAENVIFARVDAQMQPQGGDCDPCSRE